MGIVRGVEYMHKLDIIHGKLKIVRHSAPRMGHTLIFVQTNILVDARGNARIAGLGVSFLSSAIPGVDIDRLFHGTAPELVDPQCFGLTDTGTTKESDVYAFGVMAWEVSPTPECPIGKLLNKAGPLDFCWASPIFRRGRGCGGLFDVEWSSTTSS